MLDAADFGVRLRDLRIAAGLSQAVLAERAGLRQPEVSRFEAGDRVPRWDQVEAISRALGASLGDFDVRKDRT